jgi:hypothetical protein
MSNPPAPGKEEMPPSEIPSKYRCPMCWEYVTELRIDPYTEAEMCRDCVESTEEHIGDFYEEGAKP